jgi:hypothetical protein
VERWFRRYGFAALVLGALACACHLAGSATVPDPVPDFALQAEEIYRLEIGAAFFVAFYLATMAFVLALSGKGFAEFGTKGTKSGKGRREAGAGLRAVEARPADAREAGGTSSCRRHPSGRTASP